MSSPIQTGVHSHFFPRDQDGLNPDILLNKALAELGGHAEYAEFCQIQAQVNSNQGRGVLGLIDSISIYQNVLKKYENQNSPAVRIIQILYHQQTSVLILDLAEKLQAADIAPGLIIRANQLASWLQDLCLPNFGVSANRPDYEKIFYQEQHEGLRKLFFYHEGQARKLGQETRFNAEVAPQAQGYLNGLVQKQVELALRSHVLQQLKNREESSFTQSVETGVTGAAALGFFAQGFLQTPGPWHGRLWGGLGNTGLRMIGFQAGYRTMQNNLHEAFENIQNPISSVKQKIAHLSLDLALTVADTGVAFLTVGLISQRIQLLEKLGWSFKEIGLAGLSLLGGALLTAGEQELHRSTESFFEGLIDRGRLSWFFEFGRIIDGLPAALWASLKTIIVSRSSAQMASKASSGFGAPTVNPGSTSLVPSSGKALAIRNAGSTPSSKTTGALVVLDGIQASGNSEQPSPRKSVQEELLEVLQLKDWDLSDVNPQVIKALAKRAGGQARLIDVYLDVLEKNADREKLAEDGVLQIKILDRNVEIIVGSNKLHEGVIQGLLTFIADLISPQCDQKLIFYFYYYGDRLPFYYFQSVLKKYEAGEGIFHKESHDELMEIIKSQYLLDADSREHTSLGKDEWIKFHDWLNILESTSDKADSASLYKTKYQADWIQKLLFSSVYLDVSDYTVNSDWGRSWLYLTVQSYLSTEVLSCEDLLIDALYAFRHEDFNEDRPENIKILRLLLNLAKLVDTPQDPLDVPGFTFELIDYLANGSGFARTFVEVYGTPNPNLMSLEPIRQKSFFSFVLMWSKAGREVPEDVLQKILETDLISAQAHQLKPELDSLLAKGSQVHYQTLGDQLFARLESPEDQNELVVKNSLSFLGILSEHYMFKSSASKVSVSETLSSDSEDSVSNEKVPPTFYEHISRHRELLLTHPEKIEDYLFRGNVSINSSYEGQEAQFDFAKYSLHVLKVMAALQPPAGEEALSALYHTWIQKNRDGFLRYVDGYIREARAGEDLKIVVGLALDLYASGILKDWSFLLNSETPSSIHELCLKKIEELPESSPEREQLSYLLFAFTLSQIDSLTESYARAIRISLQVDKGQYLTILNNSDRAFDFIYKLVKLDPSLMDFILEVTRGQHGQIPGEMAAAWLLYLVEVNNDWEKGFKEYEKLLARHQILPDSLDNPDSQYYFLTSMLSLANHLSERRHQIILGGGIQDKKDFLSALQAFSGAVRQGTEGLKNGKINYAEFKVKILNQLSKRNVEIKSLL